MAVGADHVNKKVKDFGKRPLKSVADRDEGVAVNPFLNSFSFQQEHFFTTF